YSSTSTAPPISLAPGRSPTRYDSADRQSAHANVPIHSPRLRRCLRTVACIAPNAFAGGATSRCEGLAAIDRLGRELAGVRQRELGSACCHVGRRYAVFA